MYSSGPGATLVAFNEYPYYPGDYFIKEKASYSFEHYGLDQHFQTGNRLPLHSDYIDLIKLVIMVIDKYEGITSFNRNKN